MSRGPFLSVCALALFGICCSHRPRSSIAIGGAIAPIQPETELRRASPPAATSASPGADPLTTDREANDANERMPIRTAMRILSPTLPASWVDDGSLAEWNTNLPDGSDWLAVVMTNEGLVLAGESSSSEVALTITLPHMVLPETGNRMERGGEIARFECEFKPWTTEPLAPKDALSCRAAKRESRAYEERYERQFTKNYVVDQYGIREYGLSELAHNIPGREGVIRLTNNRLTVETTLSCEALPAAGASPIGGYSVTISHGQPLNGFAAATKQVELAQPIAFGDASLLEPVLGSLKEQSPNLGRPALVYRPESPSTIRVYAFSGWRGPFVSMLMDWVNPQVIAPHDYNLRVPGKKLGHAEIRLLPPELSMAMLLRDGEPKELLSIYRSTRVLVRNGELQLLSWEAGTVDATLRPEVHYKFVRVSAEGEILGEQSLDAEPAAASVAYHDSAFSRIGGYLPGAGDQWDGSDTRVEWHYSALDKRYNRVRARETESNP